jgi:curved DNA-binding protein CbpA
MHNAVQRPSAEELRLFSEKIARRLSGRPLDLDPVSHKRRVAEMLRQAGEVSFYQFLGVVPTATAQEVHEAYDQIARLVHPLNAGRLGLAGREGVLELLFEQVTHAYLTLFQPERRKAYDRELAPGAWAASWSLPAQQRREEISSTAQGYYQRAVDLAANEELHFAIELLLQAVRIDPRPEYYALLGKLQARNPRWLPAAAESLRQAMKLGSKDEELPAALDQILQRIEAGEASASEPAGEAPPKTISGSAKAKKQGLPEVEVLDPDGDFDVVRPKPRKWR